MSRTRQLSVALVASALLGASISSTLATSNAGAASPDPWSSRINVGGPALTDSGGQAWSADAAFSGGVTDTTTASVGGSIGSLLSTKLLAAGATDQAVYQDSRSAMTDYNIPVPGPGLYSLRLHMVETSFSAAGRRVFSVTAEGVNVATNLDLYAKAGKNKAYVLQAQVAVTGSTLDLGFPASAGQATLAGIEAWALAPPPGPTTTTAPPATTTTSTTAAPTTTSTTAAPTTTSTTAAPTTTTTRAPTTTTTTRATTTTTTTTTTTVPPPSSTWSPARGTTWQWQLTLPVDQSVAVPVYDIDGMENPASVVASLHAAGRKVICYIDAGAWENYRSDAGTYPAAVLGSTVGGWPDERWLDIRRIDLLGPIMSARFDQCKTKGFDAVEADLVDGYTNATGFPLTAVDQLRYNRYLADLAHARGLSIALKNDPEQAGDLVGNFDFAVVEECAQYSECALYSPFIAAGKAVLHVEYALSTSQFCPAAKALGFSSMKKNLSLDAFRQPC